jgi:membrane fusion protein, heavy metal efflux system
MMNSKTSKITICFIAAAALAGTAYMFIRTGNQEAAKPAEEKQETIILLTPEQIEAEQIEIRTAEPGTLQNIIHTPGKIILNNDKVMHIVPKALGIVKEVNKNIGDKVSAGEIMAVLESHDIAEAKSAYLDSLKVTRQADTDLEREQKLHDKRISAEQDYLKAVTESEQAHINLELAKQKLHTMGMTLSEIDHLSNAKTNNLRRYELRSPMPGTVISKNITKGELIDVDHEVYVVADLNTVAAELAIFPQDLELISEGLNVEIACPNGKKTEAKIVSISPVVDEDTRSVTVYALIDNSQREWYPGMYICGDVKAQPTPVALVVPKKALQKINDVDCLFVANEKGFEIRPVKTGKCDNTQIEITSGIKPGEPYASSNTFLLKAEHGKDDAQHMD